MVDILLNFITPLQKFGGGHSQKKFEAYKNFGQFCTTSDIDREYLRNEATYIQNRKTLQTSAIPPAFNEKSPVNFGPLKPGITCEFGPTKCTFWDTIYLGP